MLGDGARSLPLCSVTERGRCRFALGRSTAPAALLWEGARMLRLSPLLLADGAAAAASFLRGWSRCRCWLPLGAELRPLLVSPRGRSCGRCRLPIGDGAAVIAVFLGGGAAAAAVSLGGGAAVTAAEGLPLGAACSGLSLSRTNLSFVSRAVDKEEGWDPRWGGSCGDFSEGGAGRQGGTRGAAPSALSLRS